MLRLDSYMSLQHVFESRGIVVNSSRHNTFLKGNIVMESNSEVIECEHAL